MKYLLFLVAVLINLVTIASPDEIFYEDLEYKSSSDFGRMIQVYQTESVLDSTLGPNESIYCFKFENLYNEDTNAVIQYSIDSVVYEGTLISSELTLKTTPGTHFFKFYLNKNYLEVFSDGLPINPQYRSNYNVSLFGRAPEEPVMTFKPVIYLYPEEETEIAVNLEIHDGKHPFYYPAYNDSWTCIAQPNGNLTVDDEEYRYLFWEAQQEDHLNEIDVTEGFVVDGNNAVTFLEEHLNTFGFTAIERADFITFWGPRLAANDHNLVRFEWNETCEKFADLNISPQPDNIYRFYIFTSALESDIEIQPQEIPTMNRRGFTVLEWGGQVSNYQPNTIL